MARPQWIEVGRVSRPHGVRGEVRIIPDSDNPERFAVGSVLQARPARAPLVGGAAQERVALTVAAVRGEAGFPIVEFREIGDRESAEGIRGFVLEVPGEALPGLDEDEYYPFDLQGLLVQDQCGTVAGRVTEIIDSPAHSLLVVGLDGGGEILVPFVRAAVPDVRVAEGFLVVESRFLEST